MMKEETYPSVLNSVYKAAERLRNVVVRTPLAVNNNLSTIYNARISFKREDLQRVRSYKIRGAYNKMAVMSPESLAKGVVCASAGNHAQGVAFACSTMQVKGTIFMPLPTPGQKLEQVKMFGGTYIDIVLYGDTFDEAKDAAVKFCDDNGGIFIHPFDDQNIIDGQATAALEILEQSDEPIDYLFVPVGGGGLAAGVCTVFRQLSPQTKIIGVEPSAAASMKKALENGKPVLLEKISRFVDGAAVQKVGDLNFELCKSVLKDMALVDEGVVCETILSLYNKDAIVVEPAGALSVAALGKYKDQIEGKNVVCIISGSNNDITRMEEIKEKALLHAGLKHYFLVRFAQRPGALKTFVMNVLGPNDDITFFEYTQKNSKEKGIAVLGIGLRNSEDFTPLLNNMKKYDFFVNYLNNDPSLMNLLI
ncbi:threonine dehydratase [Chryseobacterium carnipullorum]|uniref:L-threonine dehydratase n=1 Tax=Chryseobacterium carnipullorum TaxID=1124835 RepID=A0A1M7GVS9_CHRCU|nr:threonine ammonia-lyase IlvA [Chryseobacterium carnipullorum]AZA51005.1 threonine dehydratase [Chryseobacterium carnipullorum]AZA65866.1 threonine dehydratase [Chryseobacterium carnipullorum]SHM20391.1 L-threonine ammonia-lyase [Chryseobacterium carnipullorum]STD03804.1 L-threonine dehydratase biosynthetic IlvA [Chryseobacterium carnipullorum]